jgi:hypothetical protein
MALCPHLGLDEDRTVAYAAPNEGHICYAQAPPDEIGLAHQAEFCLGGRFRQCPFFFEPPDVEPPATPEPSVYLDEMGPPPGPNPMWRIGLWIVAAILVALVVWTLVPDILGPGGAAATDTPTGPVLQGAIRPSPTSPPLPDTITPPPTFAFVAPTTTPTPHPGGQIYTLVPEPGAAGWVASDEERGNHFGDSFLYSGVFDGVVYHGAMQFDLSLIPRGATIHVAVLELAGLDAARLGGPGTWEVRLLSPEADAGWPQQTYQGIHNAPVEWTLVPALAHTELEPDGWYAFELPPALLQALEQRLIDERYAVSFRIDGPLSGENNVFAWDTGYGPASEGHKPRLLLSVGAPPRTPVASGTPSFVVVTSTPTPANVVTAAARARTATAVANTTGQPTPTSVFEVTATPRYVVTGTPTPASQATADWLDAVATAVAFTTGTFTPTPDYLMTATATPVSIPLEMLTSTPTPLPTLPVPALPSVLVGRILFQSDRAGGAGPWAMGTDGHGVALLTADWPYQVAASREALSSDGTQQVYAGQVEGGPAILVRALGSDRGEPVAVLELGQVSSPVWSPTGTQIAFVATASGSPQVWLVGSDGSGLRQLTADEWGTASHPSFSPNGNRLVYASASGDGRRQIWTVALDGTARANISNNSHDEWAPVWAK